MKTKPILHMSLNKHFLALLVIGISSVGVGYAADAQGTDLSYGSVTDAIRAPKILPFLPAVYKKLPVDWHTNVHFILDDTPEMADPDTVIPYDPKIEYSVPAQTGIVLGTVSGTVRVLPAWPMAYDRDRVTANSTTNDFENTNRLVNVQSYVESLVAAGIMESTDGCNNDMEMTIPVFNSTNLQANTKIYRETNPLHKNKPSFLRENCLAWYAYYSKPALAMQTAITHFFNEASIAKEASKDFLVGFSTFDKDSEATQFTLPVGKLQGAFRGNFFPWLNQLSFSGNTDVIAAVDRIYSEVTAASTEGQGSNPKNVFYQNMDDDFSQRSGGALSECSLNYGVILTRGNYGARTVNVTDDNYDAKDISAHDLSFIYGDVANKDSHFYRTLRPQMTIPVSELSSYACQGDGLCMAIDRVTLNDIALKYWFADINDRLVDQTVSKRKSTVLSWNWNRSTAGVANIDGEWQFDSSELETITLPDGTVTMVPKYPDPINVTRPIQLADGTWGTTTVNANGTPVNAKKNNLIVGTDWAFNSRRANWQNLTTHVLSLADSDQLHYGLNIPFNARESSTYSSLIWPGFSALLSDLYSGVKLWDEVSIAPAFQLNDLAHAAYSSRGTFRHAGKGGVLDAYSWLYNILKRHIEIPGADSTYQTASTAQGTAYGQASSGVGIGFASTTETSIKTAYIWAQPYNDGDLEDRATCAFAGVGNPCGRLVDMTEATAGQYVAYTERMKQNPFNLAGSGWEDRMILTDFVNPTTLELVTADLKYPIVFLESMRNVFDLRDETGNTNLTAEHLVEYFRGSGEFEPEQFTEDVFSKGEGLRPRFSWRTYWENNELKGRNLLGDISRGSMHFATKPNLPVDHEYSRGLKRYLADHAADKPGSSVASRYDMLYFSTNIGLLEGFAVDSSKNKVWMVESFAYLPSGVTQLALDRAIYKRENVWDTAVYDGSINHADVIDATIDSNTGEVAVKQINSVLVSGYGSAQKGLFALDVSNPQSPKALWNLTEDKLAEGGTDPDDAMGHILEKPEIVQLPDGRWVVIVAGGVSHDSVDSSLFILDLLTGKELQEISVVGAIGLSSVTGIVSQEKQKQINANKMLSSAQKTYAQTQQRYRQDRFYANSHNGGIYVFQAPMDLTGNGNLVTSNKQDVILLGRLFQATDSGLVNDGSAALDAVNQVFSSEMLIQPHPEKKGYLIYVGSGDFYSAYPTNWHITNSWYGLWDNPDAAEKASIPLAVVSRAELRHIDFVDVASSGGIQNQVNGIDWAYGPNPLKKEKGWKIDLPVGYQSWQKPITYLTDHDEIVVTFEATYMDVSNLQGAKNCQTYEPTIYSWQAPVLASGKALGSGKINGTDQEKYSGMMTNDWIKSAKLTGSVNLLQQPTYSTAGRAGAGLMSKQPVSIGSGCDMLLSTATSTLIVSPIGGNKNTLCIRRRLTAWREMLGFE